MTFCYRFCLYIFFYDFLINFKFWKSSFKKFVIKGCFDPLILLVTKEI